jgi:hypothetical protein
VIPTLANGVSEEQVHICTVYAKPLAATSSCCGLIRCINVKATGAMIAKRRFDEWFRSCTSCCDICELCHKCVVYVWFVYVLSFVDRSDDVFDVRMASISPVAEDSALQLRNGEDYMVQLTVIRLM